MAMAEEEIARLKEEIARQHRPAQWSVEGYRERFERWAVDYPPAPDLRIERLEVGDVDVYKVAAPNAFADRHIVYFHGGGYVACSAITHQSFAGDLSRATRSTVWNVDYRLAPEHPFPAAATDSVSVFRELATQGLLEPDRTVLAGESAGGGLVVATLMTLRDAQGPQAVGGVCLSPWFDLACTGASLATNQATDDLVRLKGLQRTARLYLGTHDPTDPLASPLYGDPGGLPPLLIQVATTEILLSDATRMAARAREAGVEVHLEPWRGVFHFWQGFTSNLSLAREANTAIAAFVDCCIDGGRYVSPQPDHSSGFGIDLTVELSDLETGIVDLGVVEPGVENLDADAELT